MCAQFSQKFPDINVLKNLLGEFEFTDNFEASNFFFPKSPILSVFSNGLKKLGSLFHWGLIPSWAKDPKIGEKTFNARCETVAEKPSFRDAFRKRRCIIPANGFCEWKNESGKK